MTKSKWDGIVKPSALTDLATRKVDARVPEGVFAFWAKPFSGNPMLLIQYPASAPDASLPHFKYIEIRTGRDCSKKMKFIWIELLDQTILEQFSKLCDDVVEAIERSDSSCLATFVKLQLDKWNHLFSSKRLPLTANEQKGLIAELFFLERFAMKKLAPVEAIRSWTGPLKSPRDFSFGNTFVEVKSNRGSQNPVVLISSEHQLATNNDEELLLYVVGLNSSCGGKGFCITDVVDNLIEKLGSDYYAIEELMLRLASVGFSADDDYSSCAWEESDSLVYCVIEGFPRLQAGDLQLGVSHISYEIDLNACEEFLVDSNEALRMLGVDNG